MTTPTGSRWAGLLQTQEPSPLLDLDAWIGQRSGTFRFDLVDIITGYRTPIHPIDNTTATLTHDTSRTITRTISGLFFDAATTALLNVITSRIELFMTIGGQDFPLGRYMFSDQNRIRYTAGVLSNGSFYDEMFVVDQQIDHAFAGGIDFFTSGNPPGSPIVDALTELFDGLPIVYTAEPTPYTSIGVWPAGTHRGQIVEQYALDGDYFPAWFDNLGIMRFIRSFDPALAIPTFNFDTGNKVLETPPPVETDDLINAPNRFVVIGNGAMDVNGANTAIVGIYDIPASAPHSIPNRGFVIPKIENRQVQGAAQAQAVATNLGLQQTVFERVELSTAPDPRHDSYDVIRWAGENWLELAWSLPLEEGAPMRHVMRKTYTP